VYFVDRAVTLPVALLFPKSSPVGYIILAEIILVAGFGHKPM
jgi:hypothetical protein